MILGAAGRILVPFGSLLGDSLEHVGGILVLLAIISKVFWSLGGLKRLVEILKNNEKACIATIEVQRVTKSMKNQLGAQVGTNFDAKSACQSAN